MGVRELPLYQVDAFTETRFRGNPAAVCPLGEWLPEPVMQAIAAENCLSETAFFVREGDAWRIRWFTPTVEVDLCGHATLASTFVIATEIEPGAETIRFRSRSGDLAVRRDGDRFVLDFPARELAADAPNAAVAAALGRTPDALHRSSDGNLLAVYDTEANVRALAPDALALAAADACVIATAPGEEVDFVSRYFAPSRGVFEDPVTGSAHCTSIPYWAARLGKIALTARQVSRRGGELWGALRGDRVDIAGAAVLYLRGTVLI